MNCDFRMTPEDTSQRMLNALEVGALVLIYRYLKTAKTVVCSDGCLDEVYYEELPNIDAGDPIHDGERAFEETCFKEIIHYRFCAP